MLPRQCTLIAFTSLTAILTASFTAPAAAQPLHSVDFSKVALEGEFWGPRQQGARKQLIPYVWQQCADTGRLSNFAKAAKQAKGGHEGFFFNDSDVYKLIEAAAYALALQDDPALRRRTDDLIDTIVAAQQPDGYLNTYFQLTTEEAPWSNVRVRHELYCAGHLIEAGIAYAQATGERKLLEAAIRFADLIVERFRPGGIAEAPGHQEIELALIRLADFTGDARYLQTAKFFIDQRGRADGRQLYGEYCQDHAPVTEHDEIVGHAVRAMYLYVGVTDLVARTGDESYLPALRRIWRDTVERRMYVTGGLGASAQNEGFTKPYDLPNADAYAETCASIGLIMWSHRLGLLHADAAYIDVLERVLYNGALSGVALDGQSFFYRNPLASTGDKHRQPWYRCACCPPNIARLLMSVGKYVYATGADDLYVNLYASGTAQIDVAGTPVTVRQRTHYPWDGRVDMEIAPPAAADLAVHLRIPGWCRGYTLRINDVPVSNIATTRGYAVVRRTWKPGDTLKLELAMPPERIVANPKVENDRGHVALQRGPIVYCLEGVDNDGSVADMFLPRTADLAVEPRPDLLGGVTVLTGVAERAEPLPWKHRLYQTAGKIAPRRFVAIPYYAWNNRGVGEMTVWVPETPGLLEAQPDPRITATASFCHTGDTVTALYDDRIPTSSGDTTIPRFTWWNHLGTAEWVQLDFTSPWHVRGVEVYWFDDSAAHGACRPPASWRLLYKDGDSWTPVAGTYPTALDTFNRISFAPVTTSALRLEVQLQSKASAGILEWKIIEVD